MKIHLVGDPASGKTTALKSFNDPRCITIPEEGRHMVPPIVEENKFFGYIWFYLYYYNREKSLPRDRIPIIERGLSEDYALLEACFVTQKITQQERDIMQFIVDRMTAELPLASDDLAIIFSCHNDVIRQRLEARGRAQGPEKDLYWNTYRHELKKYYIGKCRCWEIDTSDLSKDEMVKRVHQQILEHLSPSS